MDADKGLAAPRPRGRDLEVLVVDGHRLVAESVARMLPQLACVRRAATATSLPELRTALRSSRFDVALVRELLEDEPVFEVVRRSVPSDRRTAVLVLATSPDAQDAATALRAGALGWLSDDSLLLEELDEAFAAVCDGRHWVPPELRSEVIDALVGDCGQVPPNRTELRVSVRQSQVLELLTAGMSHSEVAASLQLSLNTVRTHVRQMCQSAGVHSTPALVALARNGRLVTSGQDVRPRPT